MDVVPSNGILKPEERLKAPLHVPETRVLYGSSVESTWEIPKIGGPNIDPQIVGLLL